MSLSSQLLRSSFQHVLADVPDAQQPQFPLSGDAVSEGGGALDPLPDLGRSFNSTLPHPLTPDPNSGTPKGSSMYRTEGASSRNDTFYSAGGLTQRTYLSTDQYMSADEALSPTGYSGGGSDFEQKSAWVLQPVSAGAPTSGAAAASWGAPASAGGSSIQETFQTPLSGEVPGGAVRMTSENSQNDDRIGYADVPSHLVPNAIGSQQLRGT